jgi:SanA protein
MKKIKKFLLAFIVLLALTFFLIYYCDQRVSSVAEGKTFSEAAQLPNHHVGLLLGTAKYLKSGAVNPYYSYRINAATTLLNANKVEYLVISGDNSREDYNEPEMMRGDLIVAGIDSSRIYLDYAGFRTFDSMIRLREIFLQDTVTENTTVMHLQEETIRPILLRQQLLPHMQF